MRLHVLQQTLQTGQYRNGYKDVEVAGKVFDHCSTCGPTGNESRLWKPESENSNIHLEVVAEVRNQNKVVHQRQSTASKLTKLMGN